MLGRKSIGSNIYFHIDTHANEKQFSEIRHFSLSKTDRNLHAENQIGQGEDAQLQFLMDDVICQSSIAVMNVIGNKSDSYHLRIRNRIQ